MNILIVEDSQEHSVLLKEIIKKWGHTADVAETGQAAVRQVRRGTYDLILMDIFLPDIMAYDLIPELKQDVLDLKIITMTGYSSKEVEEKVRSQGILYYMVKPVDLAELKSLIDHIRTRCRTARHRKTGTEIEKKKEILQ